jgi:hypothetical protein
MANRVTSGGDREVSGTPWQHPVDAHRDRERPQRHARPLKESVGESVARGSAPRKHVGWRASTARRGRR